MTETAGNTRLFIAGAGPVGLTAALELARRGYRPAIVDDDGEPSPESRALAINPRTLQLLEPSGMTERILAKAHRIHGLIVRHETQVLARIDLANLSHRFRFIASLPQSDTETLLIDALKEHGIEITWFTPLSTLTLQNQTWICNGTPYDVLIGADGAHSFVRKSLGIGFEGESDPASWGLADIELDAWPFPWDCVVATLFENYLVAFIPMREGFGRFFSSRADVTNVLPPEARVGKVVWQTTFRISYRQAKTYQKDMAFLAGDAAHIHSPVGGRGMNLGIEDACWLAWLIERGRTAEYTHLRHPVGAAVLRQTQAPTQLLSSGSLLSRFLRRVVLPPILNSAWVQRRILPQLAGLASPAAPWL
jgi:2-polyprenyl-6-methoxyphenol hydroxylase-like FAD-dependent oxidoreductase